MMTPGQQRSVVVLVVPNGAGAPIALAAAVRRLHPEVDVVAVWAGDPHLHPPVAADVTWHRPAGVERIVASADAAGAGWWCAARTALDLLEAGHPAVVVFDATAVGVLGQFDELLDGRSRFVARVDGPVPDDGRWPTADDLERVGPVTPSIASFGPDAGPCLASLLDGVTAGAPLGRVLALAADQHGVPWEATPGIGVGVWRWDAVPRVVDVAGFDPDQPWVLDPRADRPARIRLVGHDDRIAAVAAAAGQLAGIAQQLVAPGCIPLDDTVRSLIEADPAAPLPWSEPAAFRAWLATRWWAVQRRSRPDLARVFPPGEAGDAAFERWCERAVLDDGSPLLVPMPPTGPTATPTSQTPPSDAPDAPDASDTHGTARTHWPMVDEPSDAGVDVIGYFTRQLGLAQVAVTVVDALAAASVPVGALALETSNSPEVASRVPLADRRSNARSVLMVNADQMASLRAAHPELLDGDRPRVGFWFWEVERVPAWMRSACADLDEVWAATRFVADALATALPVPVRHVPLPVADVRSPAVERSSAHLLEPFAGRFVFLVVFDHFSVTERKNPVGAIEAFRRAFEPGEGPVLVVKSLNGDRRWAHHERLLFAAAGRPDIAVVDTHLSRDEHLATVAAADVLVSLHRSEGLGLHLAEALWLGTPVIATRYSGNLDFMDDSNSVLVDATLVPVTRAEGGYPDDAVWADPELDQAAAAMRALAGDPTRCAALAAAGRARMERQPSLADTGRAIADLLGIEVAS